MRLKCIKLIGFKSFVEATTVSFPSNLCAVVGPNGCGKSNIIDAVRWVMGESSAKNLRGESMMDVIFKGSKKRKPAGYAQIELLFDNQAGRITGEYAAYSEISVKRRLRSDGQNHYFLNGNKCRRRDIMDIFLGTGLGPRSYSIISQGMISNLIESKPEELRVFLEEAAGISKYKERRRETENRMRRTLENLDRLTDLRDELTKRLAHLKHQAEDAEKYKSYQENFRKKRAELHALRWKALNTTFETSQAKRVELEVQTESYITQQVNHDTQLEKYRITQQEQNDQFQKTQSHYYQLNNSITRIEQTLTHQTERCEQLAVDLKTNQTLQAENLTQLETDQANIARINHQITQLNPEQDQSSAYQLELENTLALSEEELVNWHQHWDICIEKSNHTQRETEVLQSNIQHTEHVLTQLNEQIILQQTDLQSLNIETLQSTAVQLKETFLNQQALSDSLSHEAKTLTQTVETLQNNLSTLTKKQQTHHQDYCETQGQYASLMALQAAADQADNKPTQWLAEQGFDQTQQLSDILQVKPGWELATETILGDFLQARVLDDIQVLAPIIDHLDSKQVNFILQENASPTTNTGDKIPLTQYVSGASLSILNSIYIANSLSEAWSIRSTLAPTESVITSTGIWMGRDWVRIPKIKNPELTLLHRQKTLTQLQKKLNTLQTEKESIEQTLSKEQLALNTMKEKLEKLALQRNIESQRLGELTAEYQSQKQQIDTASNRREITEQQLNKSQDQQHLEKAKLTEYREKLETLLDLMQTHLIDQETLRAEKDLLQEKITHNRCALSGHQESSHDLLLQYTTLETQRDGLQQVIERATKQQEQLTLRLKTIQDALKEAQTIQADDLSTELTALLEQQSQAEVHMNDARIQLDKVTELFSETEKKKQDSEHALQQYRSQLETIRLEEQETKVRCQTLEEQVNEGQFKLNELLADLSEEAQETDWISEIEKLESKINKLGPINLAAIDEYEQQSERLNYLNTQNDDLQDALNTLEKAIDRIDQETRQRFESTFNAVNDGLNLLFPRIFGGGKAYLLQTDNDLLNTGIAIMAQPPGKKNTTIHLLSGGEKALTAIALVFSIFRLNPSPFCMLDEVDAPLDDANVGRYINMVKEMSEQIQFIYVTHNKVAMESANQLIGITMHEPGVSRPVSVDIDSAVGMIST